MALIKPFECVRPNEKDAARVAALPEAKGASNPNHAAIMAAYSATLC